MKSLLIVVLSFFTYFAGIGQYDVTLNAIFSPSVITIPNTSNFTMSFCNLTPTALTVPTGGVGIQANWGSGYIGDVAPTGSLASSFDWYDIGDGWFGVSNVPLPFTTCGNIVFPVTGTMANGAGSQTSYSAQILVTGGSDINGANNNGSQVLVVAAPLPIKLVSFEGRSVDCNHIDLTWQTAQERNNDYIEVQRSINGTEFVTIGKVSGSNRSDLNSYTFEDKGDLIPNAKYYYRLRQVDYDGRAELHRIIAVEHTCKEAPLALNIYPNPAIDKINIILSGMKSATEVKLSVLNNDGQTVRSLTINSGVNNEYLLNDLPAGVYHLRADGLDQTLNARFIRIQ